jgi:hypothetical protein
VRHELEQNWYVAAPPQPRRWTVGELHVLDRRIVPNARRDNFEVNHHYYNLLVQLGPLAAKITQRCRSASVARNATQIVRNVIAATTARLKERRSFPRRTFAPQICGPERRYQNQTHRRCDHAPGA